MAYNVSINKFVSTIVMASGTCVFGVMLFALIPPPPPLNPFLPNPYEKRIFHYAVRDLVSKRER